MFKFIAMRDINYGCVLFLMILVCTQFCSVHAMTSETYMLKEDKILSRNVEILDLKQVTSLIECTVTCGENDRCVSTNLSPRTGGGSGRTCELLDGARLRETEAELEEAIGWTHTCE